MPFSHGAKEETLPVSGHRDRAREGRKKQTTFTKNATQIRQGVFGGEGYPEEAHKEKSTKKVRRWSAFKSKKPYKKIGEPTEKTVRLTSGGHTNPTVFSTQPTKGLKI